MKFVVVDDDDDDFNTIICGCRSLRGSIDGILSGSGSKFYGFAHLRCRPQLLAAADVTGSAVNGVSQLVLGDKL